ncbi:MAG: DUF2147 domain-containing protein [Allosphingosinicella sp.]
MLIPALALMLAIPPGMAGDWLTADRSAIVRIGSCGRSLCGRIVRVMARGAPPNDANNPARALRPRPLIGVAVLSGFPQSGVGDGRAYDPKSGRSYRSRLRLNADGTLRVTGCVSVICRSQTWTRAR